MHKLALSNGEFLSLNFDLEVIPNTGWILELFAELEPSINAALLAIPRIHGHVLDDISQLLPLAGLAILEHEYELPERNPTARHNTNIGGFAIMPNKVLVEGEYKVPIRGTAQCAADGIVDGRCSEGLAVQQYADVCGLWPDAQLEHVQHYDQATVHRKLVVSPDGHGLGGAQLHKAE